MELKITEYDGLTKEIIERAFSADEMAEYEAREAKFAALKAQAEAKAEAKLALLEKLGITEDEAKLLIA